MHSFPWISRHPEASASCLNEDSGHLSIKPRTSQDKPRKFATDKHVQDYDWVCVWRIFVSRLAHWRIHQTAERVIWGTLLLLYICLERSRRSRLWGARAATACCCTMHQCSKVWFNLTIVDAGKWCRKCNTSCMCLAIIARYVWLSQSQPWEH